MRTWNKIGVIGAGNMGSGIAQKIATEGFSVIMVDVSEEAAQHGLARIRTLLDEGVAKKIFTPPQVTGILGRLSASGDFATLAGCDLVIEAVFEDLKVKQDVFARAAAAAGSGCLLATNTSSFRVTDLARGLPAPERFLGLHYFYHPAKNRLVEVIAGAATDPQAFVDAWRFQERIGKTPIRSGDAPGFIVNRYFVPWLNEAVRMLEENVANLPTIERAASEAFAIGMGPFELMNVTGTPIALHAATTLGRELGPFYAPASLLAQQVERKQPWSLEGAVDSGKLAMVSERLRAVVYLVAAQMVDEGVCSREDCDIGARVGLRWAKGPFELVNQEGVAAAARAAGTLAARWRLEVPRGLREQAARGQPFELRLVELEVAGGVATVRFNRPDAMNALNPEVMRQLAARFDEAAGRSDVRAIVLAEAGKAFVAGADIKFFVDKLDAGAFADIHEFTRQGAETLARIDHCPKLVICRLDGLSLGGGSELALCADIIVASERGSLGFPETGIGIYPGLGGTQRTTRRVGAGLAKWLIYTGQTVDAKTAFEIGLIDEVIAAGKLDERIHELTRASPPPPAPPRSPSGRWKQLADFFASKTADEMRTLDAGKLDPEAAKVQKRVTFKAPVALRLAERCIDTGVRAGEEAGLAAELANLEQIFATKDAYEGLSSVLQGRRPTFTGH